VLYDGNESLQEKEIRERLEPGSLCEIILGELPEKVVNTLDLVVMSPGVPLDIPPVQRLKTAGIPIWGEVELAYEMGLGKVLAITGTNGKTTTTALLGEIMKADKAERNSYDSVFVVGNIGNAYTGAALSMTEHSCTVAEISSFQLETTEHFAPCVSGILNITEII
ncbi:UDP-N-acetylmuramoylalanine-D-glutamate ligase, partial [gut metagenome]